MSEDVLWLLGRGQFTHDMSLVQAKFEPRSTANSFAIIQYVEGTCDSSK